jgi:predicted ATP-grasp superfamily ATP-dependent carboligase
VSGRAVSALFLAAGRECRIVGFSEQWAAPLPHAPFRYGGAARPARIAPELAASLGEAAARIAGAVGLRGLNAADFLVGADGFQLLEINPRPGATLDVFAQPGLFRLHVAACRGVLPGAVPAPEGGAAAMTVYARRRLCLPAAFAWPAWTADRQPAGVPVPAGAPLCTALAEAADADGARRLVLWRAETILDLAETTT